MQVKRQRCVSKRISGGTFNQATKRSPEALNQPDELEFGSEAREALHTAAVDEKEGLLWGGLDERELC